MPLLRQPRLLLLLRQLRQLGEPLQLEEEEGEKQELWITRGG